MTGQQSHLSFSISRDAIHKKILIPKYYDPELVAACEVASAAFETPALGDLLLPGRLGSRLGVWIEREHYGSGPIPYVRTSDFNNWRLRPDFKKAVSQLVHDRVESRVDICSGDILMVAHGTYLVGTVAIVTESDLPLVLQDHVFRLRLQKSPPVNNPETINPHLVLAALSTRFVRQQVRARQFSADIIDKIGERHIELRVPIPRDLDLRTKVTAQVRAVIDGQTAARIKIAAMLGSDLRMTRERALAKHGFPVMRSSVTSRILIPKYYDPVLQEDMKHASDTWGGLIRLGELAAAGKMLVNTGVEVGKMAYGTGNIPFLRTTDIAELEVKTNPRQGISESIYKKYAAKAAALPGDILLVRDGTYLVGSSAIVENGDIPALICGGLYRLRSADHSSLDPYTLLALLNLPLVRRQMRSKQFTRDVIDTLGKRLYEVQIPNVTSARATELGVKLRAVMEDKARLRNELVTAISLMEPEVPQVLKSRPGWSMR